LQALTPTIEGFVAMDEAKRSLEQTPPANQVQRQVMGRADMALARQQAIKAVKLQFQRQGLKVALMSHREIVVAANDYTAEHRAEVIAGEGDR